MGCDGHFWPHEIDTIKQIPEQARDGTLSEVMELPVYQWRVRTEPSTDYTRSRRQTAGSGDGILTDSEDDDDEYDDNDYEEEEYDDGNEGITETPQEPKQKSMVHPPEPPIDEHPHRHHHGEGNIAGIKSDIPVSYRSFYLLFYKNHLFVN